jgi:sulfur carrier protein ThiS
LLNEKTLATDELARLDELLKQLKNRPLSRAIVASTDVAFVPYTQLEGVSPGVELVTCTWALFRCRTVGRVKEVLPGEVIANDPWAKTARGQYAILELTDHEAAKEKTLRARPSR